MGKIGKFKHSDIRNTRDLEKKKDKKLNPFEIHINRVKYDVVGRKTKEDRGLPGIARAKAVKKVMFKKPCIANILIFKIPLPLPSMISSFHLPPHSVSLLLMLCFHMTSLPIFICVSVYVEGRNLCGTNFAWHTFLSVSHPFHSFLPLPHYLEY